MNRIVNNFNKHLEDIAKEIFQRIENEDFKLNPQILNQVIYIPKIKYILANMTFISGKAFQTILAYVLCCSVKTLKPKSS